MRRRSGSGKRQSRKISFPYQRSKMRFDPFRDVPGANEQAEFNVPFLRRGGEIRGSDERFRPVDHDAFCVQRAPVLPGRRDGSGIVVQPRRADAGPFVLDKVLCETFDNSVAERSVGPFPAHVDAERSFERSVGIELARQFLEYGSALAHDEADRENALARLAEQLPRNDAGIARGRRNVGTAYDQVDQRFRLPARRERTQNQRDLRRRHIFSCQVIETGRDRFDRRVREMLPERKGAEWRGEETRFQNFSEPDEPGPVEVRKFFDHGGRKNAASVTPTVGTTTARSRKSFLCSQLVSAIRRQP